MPNQINRRDFLQASGLLSATWLLGGGLNLSCSNTSRPNILWIIAEDLCPDLGCYGHPLVRSPQIDELAAQGVRFTNTFMTAPVCSAARSALMTGMYQTSIDAHNHRSHREDGYQLPAPVQVITEYFRQAGYFTANIKSGVPDAPGTGKTDFNFTTKNPFDGDDWNALKTHQPFFAQINFSETHRTFKKAPENPVNPSQVEIPPYYPDHPVTREDWALYLDTVNHLDRKVGAVLKKLNDDKLAENTIVFCFSDHGRPHVRGKQWLYDGGIHIPLIIRWPDQHLAGTVRDDLISSIDISAASVQLATHTVPAHLEGRDFLNPKIPKREFIIAARDRCDETVDCIRCVRTKQFKYIRNFYPERPYTQINRYKEANYPTLRLMKILHEQGRLTPAQALFMQPTRPPEELYDLQADPHEINNLADQPEYQDQLQHLRQRLEEWIQSSGDKGQTPEDTTIIDFWENRQKSKWDEKVKQMYEQDRKRGW